ncbi:MAG: NUDIX domain-containing protein [Rhodovibrionaceae bacterium]
MSEGEDGAKARPREHPAVEILERETVYQGYFRLDRYRLRHRSHAGGWSPEKTREVFERGHCAALLPYDPRRDEVVLLRQFRLPALTAGYDPWLIEIVAGVLDRDGESPEQLARRETEEEAGLTPQRLHEIGTYLMSPGGTSESITLYCGEVEAEGAGGIHGLIEEGEDIEVFALPAEEAFAKLRNGEISNAIGAIALLWLEINRPSLRRRWAGS